MQQFLKWFAIIGGIVGMVILTILSFGINPKTVPKIKPSFLATPEEAGAAIGKRLWQELKDSPLLFLGVEPDSEVDFQMWRGFLDSLKGPDLEYQVVVVEPQLPKKKILRVDYEVDIKNDVSRFIEGYKKASEGNLRMAVVVPSIYSAQVIKQNPIHRIIEEFGIKAMSLSIARPAISREDESKLPYPCLTSGNDPSGLGPWGCLIQTKSRSLYRKKIEKGRYLLMMDLVGQNDYLVLAGFF